LAQIFSSAPCSQTPSVHVSPIGPEVLNKEYTHAQGTSFIQVKWT
jgi:hypothetical protein